MHRASQHRRHAELCGPPDMPSACERCQTTAEVMASMAVNRQTSQSAVAPRLGFLIRLIVAACLVSLSNGAAALDQVSMQLKWKHQFQFAGYYAALEQGFYRDAGLDVSIREGGPGIDVAETVASSKADFGVCNASVLREWPLRLQSIFTTRKPYPLDRRSAAATTSLRSRMESICCIVISASRGSGSIIYSAAIFRSSVQARRTISWSVIPPPHMKEQRLKLVEGRHPIPAVVPALVRGARSIAS